MRANLSIFVTACLLAACGGASQDNPVQPSIVIATNPDSLSLHAGASTQLVAQASVHNLPPGAGAAIYVAVDWSLQETNAGALSSPSANGETFTVTYTAPSAAGVYHVVASDHADGGVSSVVTVTVN